VAELNGDGVAAVLAADAAVHLGTDLLAEGNGHFHKLANAVLVQLGEGVVLVDLAVVVSREELTCVVTAEAEGHLGEVVGAKAEELGFLGDLVGGEAGSGDLHHGADFVLELNAGLGDLGIGGGNDDVLNELHLLDFAGEGDHDLGNDVPVGMGLLDVDGGADNGRGLHLGDLGVGDGQTAATVTHHGVKLVETVNDILNFGNGLALCNGKSLDVGFFGGNELVEGGIQEADGNGAAFKGLVELLEVTLLIGQDLLKSGFSVLDGVGADHFTEGGNSVGFEEHVLGTAEANALSAQLAGLLGVGGSVGVGADLKGSVLVGPGHDAAELAGDLSVNGGDDAVVDLTGGAVDGDIVALVVGLTGESELLVFLVHVDLAATGDTAGAHAAGDNSGVRGHAATDCEDALGGLHAGDVLGRGLETDKNDLFASGVPGFGVLSGEDDLAAGGAGGSAQTLAGGNGCLKSLSVELGVEQSVKVSGVDHGNSLLFGDHALVNEVAGDLKSGLGGTLAVSGLKHVELAGLNGELHVLHVSVVIFKSGADLGELSESFGELFGHFGNGHGGTDAGNNVFALGVHKELAHKTLFAGGRVTGECNTGAAIVAHVTKGHHLNVNGSAPGVGNVVVAAVNVGAGVVPGTEDGFNSAHELFLGIRGEVLADLGLVLSLELIGKLLKVFSSELDVKLDALFFLHLVDEFLEVLLADFHNDVGVHLDESSVAVVGPTGVAGLGGHDFNDFLVKTEVQDGVHHAGHGSAGAGTDGNKKGVLGIAELHAGDAFHLVDILHDLGLDLVVDLATVLIILSAGLGGNGKALGNGKADLGHLGKVGAFAAKKLTHGGVAFAEKVDKFFAHSFRSFLFYMA